MMMESRGATASTTSRHVVTYQDDRGRAELRTLYDGPDATRAEAAFKKRVERMRQGRVRWTADGVLQQSCFAPRLHTRW